MDALELPESALQQLVAAHPHFQPCLFPGEESRAVSAEELASADFLENAVRHGQEFFKLQHPRDAAQLWFYSLCNSVVAPAVALMVSTQKAVNLNLETGTVFTADGYWMGFTPALWAESYAAAGQSLAEGVQPLIETLAEYVEMRPAPLWAVLGDAVVQTAVSFGNTEFETGEALGIIAGVLAGVQTQTGKPLPPPRLLEVDESGITTELPQDFHRAPDFEPELMVALRASCCMIYHSPDAELCTACPKQPMDERLGGQVAAVLAANGLG